MEDVAYCLMGIFGINMPMLYSEGDRAFIRLQEEIIKASPDQSIFAWESDRWEDQGGGLLASSPSAFSKSGDIIRSDLSGDICFSLTGHGLSVKVPMAEISDREIIDPNIETDYTFTGVLDCQRSKDDNYVLGISLTKLRGTSKHFVRSYSNFLEEVEKSEVDSSQSNVSNVYVRQQRFRNKAPAYNQLEFNLFGFHEKGFSEKERYLPVYDTHSRSFFQIKEIMHTAAVRCADPHGIEFVVLVQ